MSVSFESLNLKLLKKVKLTYSDGTYSLKRLIVCDNFFSRLKGMLFTSRVHKDAYLIVPCNGVHTFFMFYPIDVIFLSKDVDLVYQCNLKPFTVKTHKKAFAVLEGTKLLKSNNNIVQLDFLC